MKFMVVKVWLQETSYNDSSDVPTGKTKAVTSCLNFQFRINGVFTEYPVEVCVFYKADVFMLIYTV